MLSALKLVNSDVSGWKTNGAVVVFADSRRLPSSWRSISKLKQLRKKSAISLPRYDASDDTW